MRRKTYAGVELLGCLYVTSIGLVMALASSVTILPDAGWLPGCYQRNEKIKRMRTLTKLLAIRAVFSWLAHHNKSWSQVNGSGLSVGYFSQSGHLRITAVLYFAIQKMSLWLTCSKQETSRKEWRFHKNSAFSCITDCADAFSVQFLFGSWALTQIHPPAETESAIHGLKTGASVLGNHLADRCFCLPVSIIIFSPTNSYPRKCGALVQRRKGENPQKIKNILKALGCEFPTCWLVMSWGCPCTSRCGWKPDCSGYFMQVKGTSYMSPNSRSTDQGVSAVQQFREMLSYKMCRVEPWSYKEEGHLCPCRGVTCVQVFELRQES